MSVKNFGFDLDLFYDDRAKCLNYCAKYLNKGKLGLILGAGASKALNLPSWYELLVAALTKVDHTYTLPPKEECPNTMLKEVAGKVKRFFVGNQSEYLDTIKNSLYGVGFDPQFSSVNKDLLIAITALCVGKKRGNVRNIVTYNFDSVLEWYLDIMGLECAQLGNNYISGSIPDVEILHIHGYLPHNVRYGKRTSDVLLTKKDFEDRQIGSHHFKTVMSDFYQRHLFLTIGMSSESIVDDICPYLRELYHQNEINKIVREKPFGIALVSSCSKDERLTMLEDGVIPLIQEDNSHIPTMVFEIAQLAAK